jgi:hypothetical protein
MANNTKKKYLSSPEEAIGKTVEDVYVGYEETEIYFEDGSSYTINTFMGNPRDI